MASIERTAYPRFKRYYTAEELKTIYTPTTEEKLYAGKHTYNPSNYLNFLLLLKTFQRLGYFPKLGTIPPAIINHLKKELSLPENQSFEPENPRTHNRHRHFIRSQMKVNQFDQKGKTYLVKIVTEKAYFMANPADLINVAIEELVKQRYELPSFQFLNRKDADSLVSSLKSWLADTAEKVDLSYPQNEQLIINDDGEPVFKKLPKSPTSPTLKNLEAIIAERMPNRNLIDILRNVDYWTNFTRHFGPVSGSDPKIENPTERYLLTTFTYGCNLGPVQAAKHMRGAVSSKLLSFVNRRHISIDKLNKAITDIINRYNVLDLPKLWGKGNTAAADGTKYDVREQNLLSEYHIRYGGYGGIAYHHISDKYIA